MRRGASPGASLCTLTIVPSRPWFTRTETPPISVPDNAANEGIALADFDNNGTLDMVVANRGSQEPDRVYSNDGAGNFTLFAELGVAQDPASTGDNIIRL